MPTSRVSTATLTPGSPITGPGVGVTGDTHQPLITTGFPDNWQLSPDWLPHTARTTALARAAQPGYGAWIDHVRPVGECTHPVRLGGSLHTVTLTGEVVSTTSTRDLPDGVIYKACG